MVSGAMRGDVMGGRGMSHGLDLCVGHVGAIKGVDWHGLGPALAVVAVPGCAREGSELLVAA